MKYFKEQRPKDTRVAQNFFIYLKDGRVEIKPEEIIYIEADVNYTKFVTNTIHFTSSFHLGFFEKSLESKPNFLRINKSHLLNINYLQGLDWTKTTKEAQLHDGTCLPISRRKARALKDLLWERVNAK